MTVVRRRKALAEFTTHMELRLRENDHKGKTGWRGWSKKALLNQLLLEVMELIEAKDDDSIRLECCDVANFAMMIFDNHNT